MVKTFDNEVITQSKTAFSFGTRLIVFNGRRTRRTRNDLIVLRFFPAPCSLKKNQNDWFFFEPFVTFLLRKSKGDQGTNDNKCIEQVPHIPTIRSFMKDNTQIHNLKMELKRNLQQIRKLTLSNNSTVNTHVNA